MKISAIKKSYKGKTVLDLPELKLDKGKIYCIIGANGSGKSTFARILAGVTDPDNSGNILPSEVKVGYMPQKSFPFRMKLLDNLLLADKNTARADELMKSLNLTGLSQQRADRLSGGESAKMALARLMMKSFDLIILDEPTASMDMESTVLAEAQIMKYSQETGCCTVLITHSVQQARRLADEILFFSSGHLRERNSAKQLLDAPQDPETSKFLEFYGVQN